MTSLFVVMVALVAGSVSGIVGTGSSLLLLPVLVQAYGPLAAVPIMGIAAIFGNVSRVLLWWRHIDWRAALAYAIPGVPAAALGARTLLVLPPGVIDLALGLFFWTMLLLRRRLRASGRKLGVMQLGLAGGGIGFLTGLVLSTGPLSVPAFMAYGLTGGAFLGTEAASALFLYSSKIATFASQGALPWETTLNGLLAGAGIMAGTFLSKPLVLNLSAKTFDRLMALLLFLAGLALLSSGFHSLL
nr:MULTISPECIES: sulfite exporter TauE/SafE family protein [unclassified Achromobacter]